MNPPVSRILVPVDFSPHSEEALRYAAALATGLGATLEVIHVAENPTVSASWHSEIAAMHPPDLERISVEDAGRRLEALTAALGAQAVTTVRAGAPAQTIVAHARASGAGLIVMSTHGRTGLAHVLLGSVAERVVRHAPCAVITIRDTIAPPDRAPLLAGEAALLRSALGHLGASRE